MCPIDLGADPTVGGMVATNAGGTRLLRYGDVRQNLLGLEVVLADGTVLDLMTALRKNNTGLDAKQLFVGTSGAFGVVTQAVLRVVPRPAQRATALVGAQDGAAVLRLLAHLERGVGDVLTAFEVISAAALEPVCRYQPRLRNPFGASLPPYTVDFGVGQEAAFLAQDDEILQLGAARFGFYWRQLFKGEQRFGFFGATAWFSSTYSHRHFSAQILRAQKARARKNRSKTGNYTVNKGFVLTFMAS